MSGLIGFGKCRGCGRSGQGIERKGIGPMHIECAIKNADENIEEAHSMLNASIAERDQLREDYDGLRARFNTYNLIMADHAVAFKDMESQLTKAKGALEAMNFWQCTACEGNEKIRTEALTELGGKE